MSMGMEKGAEKATTLIEYAGEKQRAKTEPTTEDAKVYIDQFLVYVTKINNFYNASYDCN